MPCCRETEAALDVWSDLRSNVSTPSTFLDPKLLTALTNTRDASNASTNTKRKRDHEAAAAGSEAAAEPLASLRGDDMDSGQPAEILPKVRRGDWGAAVGGAAAPGRGSPTASMAEVRAAAAGAIRAMSRHVSQGDFQAHVGDPSVRDGDVGLSRGAGEEN